ncbi:serine protease SPPA, chloroplastic-like [Arachis stenosperma]|uniref:serine protease SPPA, chloroplastic-like n=1 Tax=Arachis stenosperma TaxID=217475 RepID=UPI0025AD928D|nr:serine protease SPPA, chloroplastic-like [Arachis stenosperma]
MWKWKNVLQHSYTFTRSHTRSYSAIQRFSSTSTATTPIEFRWRFLLTRSSFSYSSQPRPENGAVSAAKDDDKFEPVTGWNKQLVKLKILLAFPWERVQYGSLYSVKLRGRITEQLQSRYSRALSLPQICENFFKAAYDPRIAGIYLRIDPLSCGWAKLDEIRRHIFDFRKSGKFVVAFVPSCREKEYYLASACEEIYAPPSAYVSLYGLAIQAPFFRGILDNLGIEPHLERIGKYKSGDNLTHRSMTEESSEVLNQLLDNIYTNWLDKVSSAKGKKREDIENFINEGVYDVDRLKEKGYISDVIYEDEIMAKLRKRLGVKINKNLPMVDYRKYSLVRKWTLGVSGGKDLIAIIRATGLIRSGDSSSGVRSSGVIAEKIIEKIRKVRESKQFKAVIIRIDSPGGDALASDMMWREIRLLAASKPVIASMSDIAASGGYYTAMGARAIVAESLTLTGSIGVVTAKFNLGKLYEMIGFNKEIISRGRYAELLAAEQRSFRPHEAELFAKSAQRIYKQFRDKAALSRSMTVEKMEEVAQGRIWMGKDAASHGLVDAVGGLSQAISIAKSMANIPNDRQVTVVELSRPTPSLPEILRSLGGSIVEVDTTLKELSQDSTFSNGVQVRMDGIIESCFRNSDI